MLAVLVPGMCSHSGRYRSIQRTESSFVSALTQGQRIITFDVGANDGSWSRAMQVKAQRAGLAARLEQVLVEPQPQFARALRAYSRRHNASFLPVAAWVTDTNLTFRVGRWSTGASFMGANMLDERLNRTSSLIVQAVDFATVVSSVLSDCHGCNAKRRCVIFFKLDIEGAEYRLLPHLLQNARCAMCAVTHFELEWHLNKLPMAMRHEALKTEFTVQAVLNSSCAARLAVLAHDDAPRGNDGEVPGMTPMCLMHRRSDLMKQQSAHLPGSRFEQVCLHALQSKEVAHHDDVLSQSVAEASFGAVGATALDEVSRALAHLNMNCELRISPTSVVKLFRSRNGHQMNDTAAVPRLCLVATQDGPAPNLDRTAMLTVTDAIPTRASNTLLNQLTYSQRTVRRFFLWTGWPVVLDPLRVRLPGQRCNEPPPNGRTTIYHARALAVLALFLRGQPRVRRVLYIDADVWFAARTAADTVLLERYENLSPHAQLIGNGNHWKRPSIFLNSGILFFRDGTWIRQTLALWWRVRCGWADQLALWQLLFHTWHLQTNGSFPLASEEMSTYRRAQKKALSHLRKQIELGSIQTHQSRFAPSGALLEPLELPRVLLLPSATVNAPVLGSTLPALRSNMDPQGEVFLCHTKNTGWASRDPDGRCSSAGICAGDRCSFSTFRAEIDQALPMSNMRWNQRTALQKVHSEAGRPVMPPVLFSVVANANWRSVLFNATAAVWGLPVLPVGSGSPWQGFAWLAEEYAHALEKFARGDPRRLAVTTDSSDVLVQGGASKLAAAFDEATAGKPLLIAVETGCPQYRCSKTTPVNRTGRLEIKRNHAAREAADNVSLVGIPNLLHINGGVIMGEAHAMARLWRFVANRSNTWIPETKSHSAQRGIGRFVAVNPELVAFDHRQLVSAVINNGMYWRRQDELKWHYSLHPLPTPRLHAGLLVRCELLNKHTLRSAVFVHVPGTQDAKRRNLAFSTSNVKNRFFAWDAINDALVPAGLDIIPRASSRHSTAVQGQMPVRTVLGIAQRMATSRKRENNPCAPPRYRPAGPW